jgi:GNAT superfamily N-acetyltransferase
MNVLAQIDLDRDETGGLGGSSPGASKTGGLGGSSPRASKTGGLGGSSPRASTVVLRRARREDVPALVALIAADQLGATRDGIRDEADLKSYEAAFAAIDADPAHILLVAESAGAVVGTMQLSFLPGLARRGALRAQIEAVRVAESTRGSGLGAAMMQWAIDEARRRGCALVQLTSDKSRTDAHRFYQRLGFVSSHEGMKLKL